MPKRILLADDSAATKKSVEKALGSDDYQLIIAEDGRVAIEQVNAVHPHLVLAHAMLPEVDGYDVCRKVKDNPATSHIPVLLLTGTFEPFDINRAKESRYDGFVTKPLDGPELLNLISRSIDSAVYPAVDPVVEPEPEEAEPPPDAAAVSDFPVDAPLPDAITKSDAMLDRIFPEDQPAGDLAEDEEAISIGGNGDGDIFAIIDSEIEEPEGEEPEGEQEAEPTEDRKSPDFGIWGRAADTAVADQPEPESVPGTTGEQGDGEEAELSEDSDLSWFLRKYEEKMKDSGEEPETEPSDAETVISVPDEAEVPAETDSGPEAPTEQPEVVEPSIEPEVEAEPVLEPDGQSTLSAAPAVLDEQQLEQVARRVVELLSETVVRDIAWEAVPEIAERLIRERIREIEEEAESSN